MKYKIYHNPRCSKSRETLAILNENNVEVEIIEYLKEIPTEKELTQLISSLGIKAEDLLRKNETVFKENYAGKNLSELEWIKAMVKYPNLIERPIVVKGKKAVLGRPPEKVLELM